MSALLTILNMFSGPIGALIEKAILAGVTYLLGAGKISGDAAGIAASLYAALSMVFSAITGTQTAKIQSVNTATNGVLVVPTTAARNANISPVDAPMDSRFGG